MTKLNKPSQIHQLALTAFFIALIFIMTYIPKIPIPLGYAHLGDAAIFIAVISLGKRNGAIAAALGSGLADFIGGFPLWILPTIIIKFVMAKIFYQLAKEELSTLNISFRLLLALFFATLWMAIAYTLSGAILYGDLNAALASLPGLSLKGLINILVLLIAIPSLRKISSFLS